MIVQGIAKVSMNQ